MLAGVKRDFSSPFLKPWLLGARLSSKVALGSSRYSVLKTLLLPFLASTRGACEVIPAILGALRAKELLLS